MNDETLNESPVAETPQAVFTAACAHLFMNMMSQLEQAYDDGMMLSNDDLGDLVAQVKDNVLGIYTHAFGEDASPLD